MITYDKSAVRKIYKFLTAPFLYQKHSFLAKSYWRYLLIFLENTAHLVLKERNIYAFNRITLRNFTGFVMQRGRFCITGAFRDMYVTKNNKMFVAFYWGLPVQSIGFFL